MDITLPLRGKTSCPSTRDVTIRVQFVNKSYETKGPEEWVKRRSYAACILSKSYELFVEARATHVNFKKESRYASAVLLAVASPSHCHVEFVAFLLFDSMAAMLRLFTHSSARSSSCRPFQNFCFKESETVPPYQLVNHVTY